MCDSFWQHIQTVRHVIYPSESIDQRKWSVGHTFGWHHHSSVLLPLCSPLLSPSLNLNLLATLQNGQPHFYCTVKHTSTIWAWAQSDAEGDGWLDWPGPTHDVWVHSECMIIMQMTEPVPFWPADEICIGTHRFPNLWLKGVPPPMLCCQPPYILMTSRIHNGVHPLPLPCATPQQLNPSSQTPSNLMFLPQFLIDYPLHAYSHTHYCLKSWLATASDHTSLAWSLKPSLLNWRLLLLYLLKEWVGHFLTLLVEVGRLERMLGSGKHELSSVL